MTNNNSPSRATVLDIIEGLEFHLRNDWNNKDLKERWMAWKTVLCRLEGR